MVPESRRPRELGVSTGRKEISGSWLERREVCSRLWQRKFGGSRLAWRDVCFSRLARRDFDGCRFDWRELCGYGLGIRELVGSRLQSMMKPSVLCRSGFSPKLLGL